MQKITASLWFDGKAEEAVAFYVSLFDNSKIVSVARFGEAGPGTKGSVMSVAFHLCGQAFLAINGGPEYHFTPAVSLSVACETQAEIDRLWDKLCNGGEPVRCGWLKDRYGLSWQIVPTILPQLLQDKDMKKAQRVMQAMLQMIKLDIAGLKDAYDRA